ncbi:chemotaxis protein CheA [Sunxiuqinia sp. A32]|uniref:chemotaxis protein CheA n=1 Tax=Sunxiuqinia sp. A32 TaxID=3461496 RepID=UPI004046418E
MMDKFQQRFIDEAKEHFENIELALINLESNFSNADLISEIFRSMHSLKGSGAMFGFTLLSDATHDMESLYDLIRSGSIPLNSAIISFTLKSLDLLKQLLELEPDESLKKNIVVLKANIANLLAGAVAESDSVKETSDFPVKEHKKKISLNTFFIYFKPAPTIFDNGTNPLYLIEELHTFGECVSRADLSEVPPLAEIETEKCYTSWRCLLRTDQEFNDIEDVFLFVKEDSQLEIIEIKNESLLVDKDKRLKLFDIQIEEALQLAVRNELEIEEVEEKEEKVITTTGGQTISSIRVSSAKIDEYMNLVSEMITAQSRLVLLSETRKDPEIELVSETFEKLIRQLRDNAFDMSLVPMFNMVARFKRLVRDLSEEMNKEIELETEGLETEVDKNMIEKLTDPLLHIIRNCIDHGIETKDERIAAGKKSKGTIHIKASYVGTFVQIEISDDGSGLNFEKIKQRGIEKGMIDAEAEISQTELMRLILEPGFSTANSVSGVSGRGVGMDVVRKAIKNLRGEIDIDSTSGEGTQFIIRLPLTLSIIDGLLTKVGDEFFVIPTGNIEKIYALQSNPNEKNIRQVVVFEGREIPYLNLHKEFNPDAEIQQQQYLIAVKVNENQLFGLVVDDVLREYQAVVKPLGKMLKRHDIFFGASILGDGKIALVIDINKIIQKFSA